MNIQKTQAHQSRPAFKNLVLSEDIVPGSKLRKAITQVYSDKAVPAAKKAAEVLTREVVRILPNEDGDFLMTIKGSNSLAVIRPEKFASEDSLALNIRRSLLRIDKEKRIFGW